MLENPMYGHTPYDDEPDVIEEAERFLREREPKNKDDDYIYWLVSQLYELAKEND